MTHSIISPPPSHPHVHTAPVSVVESPANRTALYLQPVSFSCLVRGSHDVTLNWVRHGEGVLMSDASRVTVTEEQLNETFYLLRLEFMSVELSDDGTYTCNASNQHSSDRFSATDAGPDFHLVVHREWVKMLLL